MIWCVVGGSSHATTRPGHWSLEGRGNGELRTDAVIDAVTTLRRLAAQGDSLRAATAPGGAFEAHLVGSLVRETVGVGDEAVRALEAAKVGAGPVEDVRRAVALLGRDPISTRAGAHASALDVAATARRSMLRLDDTADDTTRAALLQDIFDTDAAALDQLDWRRVQRALSSDRAIGSGPRTFDGEQPLRTIVDGMVGGGEPAPALQRYVDAWRMQGTSGASRRTEVATLVRRDPTELAPEDWRRFGALLDADPDGAVVAAPRTIEGLQPLRTRVAGLADGTGVVDAELQRYVAAWRVHTTPPDEVLGRSRELFGRDPETLTQAEWGELRLMLDSDPGGTLLQGPRDLRGTDPLATWLPGLEAGTYRKVDNALDRYFEAWRLHGADDDAIRATAAPLVARSPDSLARRDWARLAASFDTGAGTALPGIDSVTAGDQPVGKLLAQLATGERKGGVELADWFRDLRRTLDPDHDARLAAAIDSLAAGRGTPDDARLLAGESLRLEELLATREPIERLHVVEALLSVDTLAPTRAVGSTLTATRTVLRELPDLPTDAEPIIQGAIELADHNLARIAGKVPNPTSPGIGNFPDYGEIGRIRANVQLMRQIVDPTSAAPVASQPAADVDAAARVVGDSLTW